MSNIVPMSTAIPAHLANRVGKPSALAASLGGGLSTGADFPRISIKASRFRIVQGSAETVLQDPTLEVVVWVLTRTCRRRSTQQHGTPMLRRQHQTVLPSVASAPTPTAPRRRATSVQHVLRTHGVPRLLRRVLRSKPVQIRSASLWSLPMTPLVRSICWR